MELLYENSGRATFLVYTLKKGDKVDSIGLGMLGNNSIPGILPIAENHHDEESRLLFNITSQISLTKLLMGKISRKKILTIFISICDALLEAESFLLDENLFLLDKDYIFSTASNGSANLVYLPIVRETGNLNLTAFFKDLIISVQSDPEEELDYVAKIISFLNSKEPFDLVKFREMIYRLRQPREIQGERVDQPKVEKKTERHDSSKDLEPLYSEPLVAPDRIDNRVENDYSKTNYEQASGINEDVEDQKGEKKSLFGGLFKKKPKEEKKSLFAKKDDDEVQIWGFEIPEEAGLSFEVPEEPAIGKIGGDKKLSERNEKKDNNSEVKSSSRRANFNNSTSEKEKNNSRAVQNDLESEGYTIIGGVEVDEDSDYTELTNDGSVKLSEKGGVSLRRASLTRMSNNERKEITGDLFRMGRQKGSVDYVITGNKCISHVHADIIRKNGKYFITDLNSKNHTRINGKEITSGKEYPIHSGDHIFLSNEEFLFTE